MKDKILEGFLSDFSQKYSLETLGEDDQFEQFVNFNLVSKLYPKDINIDDLSVGGANDTAIDGVAIIVNGSIINDEKDIEFFIKSPGIPYNDFVKEVQKRGIKVLDEIEVAYNYMVEKNLKTKIIAITGTNGKSTTTAKISDLLNYAGYKACYAGNIGRSLSEALLHEKDLDFVSLELSSFQLENVENFRPYISMIINMGPDHIERYKSFDEYYDTKFNIAKNQDENQYFIENIDDIEIEKRA